MEFKVSYETVLDLTRQMVTAYVEWGIWQDKANRGTVESERAYARSRWCEEVGRCEAYGYGLSVIIRIAWPSVDAAMRDVVPPFNADHDKLSFYSSAILDSLGVNVEEVN